MQFKHKDLLNEFNRQVQSGEYEKGWWQWEHSYTPGNWFKVPIPSWASSSKYRFSKSEKHPDSLLDVGDVIKTWYFTSVIAKIDNKPDDSEKYFAVIIANEGTNAKVISKNYIGQILDGVVAETRKQITEHFDSYEVIKKNGKID